MQNLPIGNALNAHRAILLKVVPIHGKTFIVFLLKIMIFFFHRWHKIVWTDIFETLYTYLGMVGDDQVHPV